MPNLTWLGATAPASVRALARRTAIHLKLVLRRLLFGLFVIWSAATLVFFIPRLSSRSPIRERFAELARAGGYSPSDLEVIVAAYNQKFGLDQPLGQQYAAYLAGLARGDLGVSLNQYPKTVAEIIIAALPWTLTLLLVTTVLSFVLGNLLGAAAAWPHAPLWLRAIAAPFVLLTGVPPVLMGVLLLFFVAFRLKLLPLGGAYSPGIVPAWSWAFFLDVARHQILPALTLILGTVGGWVLSMRGLGVTIQGEDYVVYAEHKGLGGAAIFRDYYLRNALLPQVTGLALALGTAVTNGLLVESLFSLPGLGTTLNQALRSNDFMVIYGLVLFIIVAVAGLMAIVELLYPWLDPRVRRG